MPSTYEPISTVTLTSTAQAISFTSIPSTYTDLVVIFRGAGVVGSDVRYRFNSDSGNNYAYNAIYAQSSTVNVNVSALESNGVFTYYGGVSTVVGESMHRLDIANYADTGKYKSGISSANLKNESWTQNSTIWNSTAAINRIDIELSFATSRVMSVGTTATIYGIKRA